MEKPGAFARMHAQLLQKNNWDCIAQEILISTPRRFGKTISESRAPEGPTRARPARRGPRGAPATQLAQPPRARVNPEGPARA